MVLAGGEQVLPFTYYPRRTLYEQLMDARTMDEFVAAVPAAVPHIDPNAEASYLSKGYPQWISRISYRAPSTSFTLPVILRQKS